MRQSFLFTKTTKDISKEEVSLNAQLLMRAGFVDKLMAGVYTYLPLGLRVLKKIETIIREEMNMVDGQEVLMPALHPRAIWEITGRWEEDVMFRFKSQTDKDYSLGFTHEEVVTPLVGKFVSSYKDLPVSVYQIQNKFRDELRSKSGILRGREFLMKDMYSFHATADDLLAYYERVRTAYENIFSRCGIGDSTYFTFASGGSFSDFSHEFQTITDAGEDLIYVCDACRIAVNEEVLQTVDSKCPECSGPLGDAQKSIEVGNIFKLHTKFSNAFGLHYADATGAQQEILMGCYGIGLGRVMGSVVEVKHDERGMVWPRAIAPFDIHLVRIGEGDAITQADQVYEMLSKEYEVLYDDRDDSAGAKLANADLMGIPLRIIVSTKSLPQVEVKMREEKDGRLVDMSALSSEIISLFA